MSFRSSLAGCQSILKQVTYVYKQGSVRWGKRGTPERLWGARTKCTRERVQQTEEVLCKSNFPTIYNIGRSWCTREWTKGSTRRNK